MARYDRQSHIENNHRSTPISSSEASPPRFSPTSNAESNSPETPLTDHGSPSQEGTNDADFDDDSSAKMGSTESGTSLKLAKRKRSRVTPEQLACLERLFAADRSPTAARRREISIALGMNERQTQIWFQNRRAKAKVRSSKQKDRSGHSETPPETPPELCAGFEADLYDLLHESEPITIIPCSNLAIGTWRRVASTDGKHDLVAYVCDSKRCLNWFIHSDGFSFKMEIPFDSIVDTEFFDSDSKEGRATFTLSRPPFFYLENVASPRVSGTVCRYWKRCPDWTEGHQATIAMRHNLVGSKALLVHLCSSLGYKHTSSISLHPPPHHQGDVLQSSSLEEPPVPFSTNGYSMSSFCQVNTDRRHSEGSPIDISSLNPYGIDINLGVPPRSTSSNLYTQQTYDTNPEMSISMHPSGLVYPDLELPQLAQDYDNVPEPRRHIHRSYSAHAVSRAHHDNESRLHQSYEAVNMRRNSSVAPGPRLEHLTPSHIAAGPYYSGSQVSDIARQYRPDMVDHHSANNLHNQQHYGSDGTHFSNRTEV